MVSQRAEPYGQFLEIGRQEDSVFGFFGLQQKIFGKEALYKGREICIKWHNRQGIPTCCHLKSKKENYTMKKTKRWLSGALAASNCCSSIFSSGQIARAWRNCET